METVTVVNRTSQILKGTWDGRHYDIPLGESVHPLDVAEAFRRQNIKMGSENPRTGEVVYLIGFKDRHDCSPVEQTTNPVERWDRSKLPTMKQNVDVVPGDNGIYSVRDVATSLPSDTNFVKA
jgi:hypothetical protein